LERYACRVGIILLRTSEPRTRNERADSSARSQISSRESCRQRWKFFVESVLGPSSFARREALLATSANGLEIDVVPLDGLVPRGQRVDLVKIDVERAQLAALEGIAGVIADKPEFMIVAEFGPSYFKEIYISPEEVWFSALCDRAFKGFAIDELPVQWSPTVLPQLANVGVRQRSVRPEDRPYGTGILE
jgi:hypothetical protein